MRLTWLLRPMPENRRRVAEVLTEKSPSSADSDALSLLSKRRRRCAPPRSQCCLLRPRARPTAALKRSGRCEGDFLRSLPPRRLAHPLRHLCPCCRPRPSPSLAPACRRCPAGRDRCCCSGRRRQRRPFVGLCRRPWNEGEDEDCRREEGVRLPSPSSRAAPAD